MADDAANQNPAPATPAAAPSAADAMAQEALRAAQEAISGLGDLNAPAQPAAAPTAKPVQLPSFDPVVSTAGPKGIDLLSNVNLNVKIELGRTRMMVEDVLKLGEGAVVELDKLAGDPVDIYVNDRHVAKGEVLVLNDNFCVRINEILKAAGETPVAQSA